MLYSPFDDRFADPAAVSAIYCAALAWTPHLTSFPLVAVAGDHEKKAGVAEHPEAFDHAGILVNGPPGTAGLPFS